MTPRAVDIVIPCFNYGHYVEEAVRSAVAQTFEGCGVLVINDGSTDDSKAVLDRLGAELPIAVEHQTNRGLVATLRRGIADTSAEFFVTLSADDRLDPRFVERTVAKLREWPDAGYCYTRMRLFGEREEVFDSLPFDARTLVCVGNYIGGGALIRRAAYNSTPGFRRLPAFEDWDLWLSFLERGYRGAFLPEPLYEWRQHAGSRNDVAPHEARRIMRRIRVSHSRLTARYLPGHLSARLGRRIRRVAHRPGAV